MHPFLKKLMNYSDLSITLSSISFRVLVLLGAVNLAVLSGTAHCMGGYTSPGSRALADSNSSGAYLIAGDRKILLRSGNKEAAVATSQHSDNQPSIVTGALLESSAITAVEASAQATVCVHKELYSITLHNRAPSETKTVKLAIPLILDGARDLRCAVNRINGKWIAVNIRNGRVMLSSGKLLNLSE
ncbi:MAG: hypothetical protein RJB13_686, partial [Pseudomonadota bacterium]